MASGQRARSCCCCWCACLRSAAYGRSCCDDSSSSKVVLSNCSMPTLALPLSFPDVRLPSLPSLNLTLTAPGPNVSPAALSPPLLEALYVCGAAVFGKRTFESRVSKNLYATPGLTAYVPTFFCYTLTMKAILLDDNRTPLQVRTMGGGGEIKTEVQTHVWPARSLTCT